MMETNKPLFWVIPLVMAGLLSGCGAQQTRNGVETAAQAIAASAQDVFEPLDPVAYEEYFTEDLKYYQLDDDPGLSREEILYMYPNEAVQVRVAKYDKDGNLSFPALAVSAKGGVYEVIVDYAKYRTDSGEGYVYQSGVGIRMRANITTFEAGVNISSLFGIAAAAESNRLIGTLRFETIGIGGKQISPLIPLPSEISIESIQAAMQAAAAIKSNLYDTENVNIYPQVFALKKQRPVKVEKLQVQLEPPADGK